MKISLLIKITVFSLILLTSYGCATSNTLSALKDAHKFIQTGQHEKAIERYEEALQNAPESIAGDFFVSAAQINLAASYLEIGDYTKAKEYFSYAEKSINEISVEASKKEAEAAYYNNYCLYKTLMNQYEDSIEDCFKGVQINTQLKRNKGLAVNYILLGYIYYKLNDYKNSEQYLQQAINAANNLDLSSKIDLGVFINLISAKAYHSLGYLYYKQGRYQEAINNLNSGIKVTEDLWDKLNSSDKLDYETVVSSIYQTLAACYARIDEKEKALEIIERRKARILSERLRSDSNIRSYNISDIQNNLDNDTVVLLYSNTDFDDLIVFAITGQNIMMKIISSKDRAFSSFNKYSKLSDGINKEIRGILNLRSEGSSTIKMLADDNTELSKIVNLYYSLLVDFNREDKRGIALKYKDDNTVKSQITKAQGNLTNLSKSLYNLLITPFGEIVNSNKKLIIIPEGVLTAVPFDALINGKGKYLIETHDVRYIQSLSTLMALKKRVYKEPRKSVLMFGDAIYEDIACKKGRIDSVAQLRNLKRRVNDDLNNNSSMRDVYCQLGYQNWDNLPGTRKEIDEISERYSDSYKVEGKNVSRKFIEDISRKGILSEYRFIHFATHGIVIHEIPELSAIVLSQITKGDDDGYLKVNDVEKLKAKADLVCLSACETGLGRIHSSEGVVGVTQAFMIAGANAVLSTLWSVDDQSTALYMSNLYKRLSNQEDSASQIACDIKRNFIRGQYGIRYKIPYYWAPFIYYGI